jgi:hypothetical protein
MGRLGLSEELRPRWRPGSPRRRDRAPLPFGERSKTPRKCHDRPFVYFNCEHRRVWTDTLRLEISPKQPHRIVDRLGANCRIKSHRIAGRRSDARTEGGRVEGPRLAVDEQRAIVAGVGSADIFSC